MPIKFRCPNCQQFLGISRSKAGIVTDCPACGRSIRVPNLDGSVQPLPSPKLNLEDTELRNALGALASLEAGDFPESEAAESLPIASTPAKKKALSEADIPIITAEPVGLEVAVPIEVIDEPGKYADQLIALAEEHVPAVPSPVRKIEHRNPLLWWMYAAIGVGLLMFGGFVGRLTSPGSQTSMSVPDLNAKEKAEIRIAERNEEPRAEPGEAIEIANQQRGAISGILTYVTDAGEARPDRGGRILILPANRLGKSLLPPDGFRVGADETDQHLLAAAADALNGKFMLADENGKFLVSDLPEGEYLALLASTFCPRESSQVLSAQAKSMLKAYFQQPERVIGQVEYHFVQLEVDGETPIELTHEFEQR